MLSLFPDMFRRQDGLTLFFFYGLKSEFLRISDKIHIA